MVWPDIFKLFLFLPLSVNSFSFYGDVALIIIIIIIYELIVHSLTWEWSAVHYNCISLQETKDNALKK